MVMPSYHIQARLHSDKVREADAVSIYQHYKSQKWEDRQIVREALIALGIMHNEGWQPQEQPTDAILTANMQTMLQQMATLTSKLAGLDFSSIRNHDGSPVDDELKRELTEFDRSASDMLGQAIFFEVEEE
jgi:hypothetical protein